MIGLLRVFTLRLSEFNPYGSPIVVVIGVCTVEYGNVGIVIGLERFVVEVDAAVDAMKIWLIAAFDLKVRGVLVKLA